MLQSTFCHITSVGMKTERDLWTAGVVSWESPLPVEGVKLPRAVQQDWQSHVQESIGNHAERNLDYFAGKLPTDQQWRLYQDFQDVCAFVDIETTGLYEGDEITTIALYDGRTIRHYVNGQNLNRFPADVMEYRLLVTYNGKRFDIPFIERYFGIRLPHAHIDLMHPLRSLGLKGGLKGCEQQVGIGRPGMDGVDGYAAVLLWHEYQRRNNAKALETLLAYNIQDTLSLHTLVVHTHNEKIKGTPFATSRRLPAPSLPESPYEPDQRTVERILRQTCGVGSIRYAG